MPLDYTRDKHGLILYDTETGEVLEQTLPSPPTHEISKYVGIEIKYPVDCYTVDHLVESVAMLDYKYDWDVDIDDKAIIISLSDEHLTRLEGKLFYWICENLTVWHYYIGSMRELEKCGVDKRRLAQTLDSLNNKGYVTIKTKDYPMRSDIKLTVHPYYAFKGASNLRNLFVEDHMKLEDNQCNRINTTSTYFKVQRREMRDNKDLCFYGKPPVCTKPCENTP